MRRRRSHASLPPSLLLRLLGGGLLHGRHLLRKDLFHTFLLLDQEGADDPVADALLALLEPAVLEGAETGQPDQALAAVAAGGTLRSLLHHMQHEAASRRAQGPDLVGLRVVPRVLLVSQTLNHDCCSCAPSSSLWWAVVPGPAEPRLAWTRMA